MHHAFRRIQMTRAKFRHHRDNMALKKNTGNNIKYGVSQKNRRKKSTLHCFIIWRAIFGFSISRCNGDVKEPTEIDAWLLCLRHTLYTCWTLDVEKVWTNVNKRIFNFYCLNISTENETNAKCKTFAVSKRNVCRKYFWCRAYFQRLLSQEV